MSIETQCYSEAIEVLCDKRDETIIAILIDATMQMADSAYHLQRKYGGKLQFYVDEGQLRKKYENIQLSDAVNELASMYISIVALRWLTQ
jgi:hypothetical protein